MTLKENITVFHCILRREIIRINRIWAQTILPPLITMSLYFLIFGKLMGNRIGHIHGHSYMQFIVPGLIMMSVIINSYMNVSSSFFSSKFQRCIEELLVSPAENITIIAGYVFGGVYRAFIVGGAVLAVALFFTKIVVYSYPLLLVYALLSSTFFSQAGLLNGLYAQKFDDVSIVPTFVLTPLTYLGGVFYSVDQLGSGWQIASHLNPVFYFVNGFRYCFLGQSDINAWIGIFLLIALNVVTSLLLVWLFKIGKGLKN